MSAVPEARRVADIGAGGGQVALALTRRGFDVIATELTPAGHALLPAELSRRCGDGLRVLASDEVDGVVLAGLGGHSIIRILAQAPAVAGRLSWLVLQPQQHAAALEVWLAKDGYRVEQRWIAQERGRSYTVLRVRPPA